MSGEPGEHKHRHDIGMPDHAPVSTEAITKSIQAVLGTAILATLVLAAYAIVRIAS